MTQLGASWLAHNCLRQVVVGGALSPTRAAASYSLQARPMCTCPAPNETLRLRGGVIDCCLRNGAAYGVVASP